MVFVRTTNFAPAAERRVIPDPNLPVENGPAAPPQPAPVRTETSTALLDPPLPSPAPKPQSAAQLWLHRTSIFLFVLISAVAHQAHRLAAADGKINAVDGAEQPAVGVEVGFETADV